MSITGSVGSRRTSRSRDRQSGFVAARNLLSVARQLVVVLRRVPALSFAARDDEPSRRLYAACARGVSIDGGRSYRSGIFGGGRQTRGKPDCPSRCRRLFDDDLTGWTVRPAARAEKGRSSYGASERRPDRAGHDHLVSIHSTENLGRQEAAAPVQPDHRHGTGTGRRGELRLR